MARSTLLKFVVLAVVAILASACGTTHRYVRSYDGAIYRVPIKENIVVNRCLQGAGVGAGGGALYGAARSSDVLRSSAGGALVGLVGGCVWGVVEAATAEETRVVVPGYVQQGQQSAPPAVAVPTPPPPPPGEPAVAANPCAYAVDPERCEARVRGLQRAAEENRRDLLQAEERRAYERNRRNYGNAYGGYGSTYGGCGYGGCGYSGSSSWPVGSSGTLYGSWDLNWR